MVPDYHAVNLRKPSAYYQEIKMAAKEETDEIQMMNEKQAEYLMKRMKPA